MSLGPPIRKPPPEPPKEIWRPAENGDQRFEQNNDKPPKLRTKLPLPTSPSP